MRDRLIELINNAAGTQYAGDEIVVPEMDIDDKDINRIADRLLENGVIVPPCKVGDVVYVGKLHTTVDEIIVGKDLNFMCFFDCDWVMENVGCGDCPFASWHTTYEGEVDCQAYGCFSFTENDIGKTVFLTKEEAEKALVNYESSKSGK